MATTSTKRRKDAGERLKGERERLGYAPRQIAQLLGVPLEAYDAFESGTADPGIWRMPRLAACGFDVLFITTLDALERLAPNIRKQFDRFKN